MKNQTTRAAVRSASSAGNGAAVNYRCRRARACGRPPTGSRNPFNWLAPSIVDAHCLDCFAGSGALGLEALSRYAASTTLLEMERGVAQQLQKISPP